MAYFGPNDSGYDPIRHDIFMYSNHIPNSNPPEDEGISSYNREVYRRWIDWDNEEGGWNHNNIFFNQGYNFSCLTVKNYVQRKTGTTSYYRPHAYGKHGPCEGGPATDKCADEFGFPDYRENWNDQMAGTQSPRATLISDRWGIACGHYSAESVRICPEQSGQGTKYTFLSNDGKTSYERSVDVQRLVDPCPSANANVCGMTNAEWEEPFDASAEPYRRGKYQCLSNDQGGDPDADPPIPDTPKCDGPGPCCPDTLCNIPRNTTSWNNNANFPLMDPVSNNLNIKANTTKGKDWLIFRLAEPLPVGDGPSDVTPASLLDNSFFKKWFMDPDGDTENYPVKYQKNIRSCITTDQWMRTGVNTLRIEGETNPTYPQCCNGDGFEYSEANGYEWSTNIGGWGNISVGLIGSINSKSLGGTVKSRNIDEQFWGDGGWNDHFDYGEFYHPGAYGDLQSVGHNLNVPLSYDAWPDDYDFNDILGQKWFTGDSSSPYFFPVTQPGPDINSPPVKKLAFLGFVSGGGGVYSHNGLQAILDVISEYTADWNASRGEVAIADSLPDIITEFNSDYMRENSREENIDGYKVYKSSISNQGPWIDITEQNTSGNDQYTPPPYRLGQGFVDTDVIPGNEYHYYVTSMNAFDSLTEEYESFGSDVVSVIVPDDNNGSPLNPLTTSEDVGKRSVGAHHIINKQSVVNSINNTSVDRNVTDSPSSPTYYRLIDGYRLGDNDSTIPFFGYVTPFESPIQPAPDHNTNFPLYYKINGGKAGNESIVSGVPLPENPTSYQYVLGYKYDDSQGGGGVGDAGANSNYRLYVGASNQHIDDLQNYLENVETLWLSRYMPAPSNENLRMKLEPYYQSKLHFNTIPNLKKLVINPARYGNGRNEYDEGELNPSDFAFGYYSGKYLSDDIKNTNTLETLIAKDSDLDFSSSGMEFFSLHGIHSLKHLDISNNNLFVLDFVDGGSGLFDNLNYLNLSNNNIGKENSWTSEDGYQNKQESLPILNANDKSGNFLQVRQCDISNNDIVNLGTRTYTNLVSLDVSNNPRFGTGKLFELSCPSLRYLDMSNTYLNYGLHLIDPNNLMNIIAKNTSLKQIKVTGRPEDAFVMLNDVILSSSSPYFTELNLRYGNQSDSQALYEADGGVGIHTDYGFSAFNLRSVDVSGCNNLTNLMLPLASDTYSSQPDGTVTLYLKYVDISNTKLGRSRRLDEYLSRPEFQPENYPDGHVLEINAKNVRDLNNRSCSLSITDYTVLVNKWAEDGKQLILNIDNIVG